MDENHHEIKVTFGVFLPDSPLLNHFDVSTLLLLGKHLHLVNGLYRLLVDVCF